MDPQSSFSELVAGLGSGKVVGDLGGGEDVTSRAGAVEGWVAAVAGVADGGGEGRGGWQRGGRLMTRPVYFVVK
jgi:hypothetical protein